MQIYGSCNTIKKYGGHANVLLGYGFDVGVTNESAETDMWNLYGDGGKKHAHMLGMNYCSRFNIYKHGIGADLWCHIQ